MATHSILSWSGDWSITGIYFNEDEIVLPVEGSLATNIEDDIIEFRSRIIFSNQNNPEILTDSIIKKENISNTFDVKSSISNVGELNGRIMATEENLVFIFESPDKQFAGSEYMRKINDNFYKNRGIIYKRNKKFSSWSYEIRRKENE